MAGRPSKKPKPLPGFSIQIFTKIPKQAFACALLLLDAILAALIIAYVPYTKIDWDAYMSQGFLMEKGIMRSCKGIQGLESIRPVICMFILLSSLSQAILFGVLYIVNLAIVFYIYVKTDVLPWWASSLLCLSKRVHSIIVLRLFNDCIAMTLLHASLAFLLNQRWHLGLFIFSGAVSIKMNVLLYALSLLLLIVKAMDLGGVISALAGATLVQILLGLPFLLSHPLSYISRAFNLGRVFVRFWSVNFKFVPDPIFISKTFAIALLICHLALLAVFAHYKWCRNADIMTTMFVGNFIGIICALSLHYQFYSWYFHSLPYLLWKTTFCTMLRLILFAVNELCWNVYPSNAYSSTLLLGSHLIIIWGLWTALAEYPHTVHSSSEKKKK